MRRAVLPAVLVAFGACAAPATAADVTISNFAFKPTPVTILQHDSVTWHYAGPDTNHSVTSDPMQADSWDSDPNGSPTFVTHPIGSTYGHKFDVLGSFTYYCKVHTSMRGRVVVKAPGSDITRPKITAPKATGGRTCPKPPGKCKPRPTSVSFKLSEAAQFKLTVPGRPKAAVARAGKKGANTVRISTKLLPPGSYKVNVVATDAAGNRSAKVQTSVKVKRG
jgi:plastocyanin